DDAQHKVIENNTIFDSARVMHPPPQINSLDLPGCELVKQPLFGHEFLEATLFHNAPLVQNKDAVTVSYCGQPVGNDNSGALQSGKAAYYLLLGDVVQC